MDKAVFIDKDGTLIKDVPYNVDTELITLCSEVITGLIELQEKGFLIIVITNQSGVALGYFKEYELYAVQKRLCEILMRHGIKLSGFLYCPHHPDGTIPKFAKACDCRKPAPGMILKAAMRWNLNLNDCWVLGDILNDIEAGNRAGCQTILVNNGGETQWQKGEYRTPTHIVESINEAAIYILKDND